MSTFPTEDFRPFFSANRPWLSHYPAHIPAELEQPLLPAFGLLERSARDFPQHIACQYYDQQLSYADLLVLSRRTAQFLQEIGLQRGDRVGLLMPNMPEYLAAAYGVWMAGGVVVSISPLSVAEEVSALVESTNCRAVFTLDMLAPLVFDGQHHPPHVVVVTLRDRLPFWESLGYSLAHFLRSRFHSVPDDLKVHHFSQCLPELSADFQTPTLELDFPAYIIPTGGTTSTPKAVLLSHRNLSANAEQIMYWSGRRMGEERFLAVIPFFHSYGLSTCVTAGIGLAATLILHHRFKPRTVLRLMRQHGPTFFLAVPAMLSALNKELMQHPIPDCSLNYCISGGAPLDSAVAAVFAEQTGATVVEGYGLSEASPVTHVGPLDGSARPGMIGLPLPSTDAMIVDADTGQGPLATGEVGELVVQGPQVMLGYWNQPEETARVLKNGWLFTGDLAQQDEDGYFRIVDRKKDLIITSGFNVYPNEVEAMLRRFPGVREVAVIGVDDPDRGQVVKAMLVMNKGIKFDQAAFDHFIHEHLGKHKRPRLVEVVNELPRNFLGKVQRRKLRDAHSDTPETVTMPPPGEE